MAYLDAQHLKELSVLEKARLERAKYYGTGPSSIARRTKRDNASKKARQRLDNLAARAAENSRKR